MKISKNGIEYIKKEEGTVRCVYIDSNNCLTIGTGHLLSNKDCLDMFDKSISNLRIKYSSLYLDRNNKKLYKSSELSNCPYLSCPWFVNNTEISKKMSDFLLRQDLKESEKIVNNRLNISFKEVKLTQKQYDCMVSQCFNSPIRNLEAFKRFNDKIMLAEYFDKKIRLEKSTGLKKRYQKEKKILCNNDIKIMCFLNFLYWFFLKDNWK